MYSLALMPFRWKYLELTRVFFIWTLGLNHLFQKIWLKYCKFPAYIVFFPPKTTERKKRKRQGSLKKTKIKQLISVMPFPKKGLIQWKKSLIYLSRQSFTRLEWLSSVQCLLSMALFSFIPFSFCRICEWFGKL